MNSFINIANGKDIGNGIVVKQDMTSLIKDIPLEEIINDSLLDLHIHIEPTAKPHLSIQAEENIISCLNMQNDNGCLKISSKGNYITTKPIKINIVAPYLSNIVHKGSGKIVGDYIGKDLNINLEGMGDIKLNGNVERLDITQTGMGNTKMENLWANHSTVELKGMGNIKFFAKDTCFVKNLGMGTISVFGEPAQYYGKNSGMGKIKKIKGKTIDTNNIDNSINNNESYTHLKTQYQEHIITKEENKVEAKENFVSNFKKKLKSIL